ncbi:MAG: hypothetical protein JW748_04270 [Anaerolineales bacterium]|nr:hypothetical protein [Anaerolineales bacterium]
MRKIIAYALILSLLLSAFPGRVLAAGGNILYLIAWGGYAPDTAVTVQTTVQATEKQNNTSLYYTISLGGTVYATHTTPLGRLNAWETATDEWSTMNTGWPAGTYTITVCWSPGSSTNCGIAGPVTTTYYIVPTLGWGLSLTGLAFLMYFLWRRRAEFEPAGERIRA